MSLLEKATIITTPTAHSNGTLHSIKGGAVADFDVVRGSAATRVNAEGLIEDISILSGELVTNGDFSNGSTDWVLGAKWSIGGGFAQLISNDVTGSSLIPNATIVSGSKYKCSIDAVVNSGSCKLQSASGVTYQIIDETKTYNFNFVADNPSMYFNRLSSISNITITNISVVEVIDATNIPRIDYTTGEGVVLLEPQSTNLCVSSNVLTLVGAGVVTLNAAISPDGTLNATSVNFNTGINDGARIPIGGSSATASTDYTISFYAKNASGDGTFRVRVDTNSQSSLVSETFTATSEWVRYTHTFTTDASATSFGVGSRFRKGTDNNDVLFYGVQLEELPYPSSYIPTSGEIATRLADSVTGAGDATTFNSTEGVLYAEMAALADDGTNRYITISDGSLSNYVRLTYTTTSNQIAARYYVNGAFQCALSHILTDETEFIKVSFKWRENDFALWVNGVEVATDTSGNVNPPNTFYRLDFSRYDGIFPLYGKLKALAVFNEALTDSELECLTKI